MHDRISKDEVSSETGAPVSWYINRIMMPTRIPIGVITQWRRRSPVQCKDWFLNSFQSNYSWCSFKGSLTLKVRLPLKGRHKEIGRDPGDSHLRRARHARISLSWQITHLRNGNNHSGGIACSGNNISSDVTISEILWAQFPRLWQKLTYGTAENQGAGYRRIIHILRDTNLKGTDPFEHAIHLTSNAVSIFEITFLQHGNEKIIIIKLVQEMYELMNKWMNEWTNERTNK